MIAISPATTSDQLDQVRNFMRTFVTWHRERHHES